MTTGSAGRLMTVEVNTSGSSWVALSGLRSKGVSANSTPVDITNSDSSNWQTLMDGEGLKNVQISAAGVVDIADKTDLTTIIGYFTGNTIKAWRTVIDGLGTYQGSFKITALAHDAAHDGATMINLTLNSSGAVSFTAAS